MKAPIAQSDAGSLLRATKRLAVGGCRPLLLAFRCARLLLHTARYRGQRGAWQVGFSAVLGLTCRRLATAGNGALCLSCRRLNTAGNEALDSLAGGECCPRTPLSAAFGISCRRLAAANNERDHDCRVKFLASVHE
jgi:hypothetical protein